MELADWKRRASELKREVYALYFACRDARVPWYAKALAGVVVAYAFSPIDLIPDFIPVLGYVDEMFLIPLGNHCCAGDGAAAGAGRVPR